MSSTQQDQYFILNLSMIANKFSYYSCLTIVNLGLLSNILNIIVCFRKNIRKKTMGFYNVAMSTFDIINFVLGYMVNFPPSIGHQNFYLISDISCSLLSYIIRICVQMSSWLNVMVSFDRIICILYPSRFKFIENKNKLSLIMLSLFFIICIINVPNAFFSVIVQVTLNPLTNQTLATSMACSSTKRITLARDIIAQLMRTLIPVILEAILNTLLVYKIVKEKKSLNISRSLAKEYKFAFTIVMLNFTFLFTQTPLLIITIYLTILNQQGSATPRILAIVNFSYGVSVLFSSYMFGSLFFINLQFNKIFQNEVKNIFHMLKRRKNRIFNSSQE